MSLTSITKDFFVKAGLTVLGTNAATSSTANTSTLQVDGGAGIAKNIIVGTTAQVYGATSLYGSLGVTGDANLAATTATSLNVTGRSTLGEVTASATTATSLNVTNRTTLGEVTAGATTATSLNVTGRSTLGEVTAGVTTVTSLTLTSGTASGVFNITNSTAASSTSSGALQVTGGAGIGGDLWVGGTANFAGAITGNITTATNLAGGTQGSLPYQTAAGTTAFIPIGTAGFILMSNGTTASWVTTATVAFGQATTASNLQFGAQYQIPYQTDAGKTAFEPGFEYNYTSNTFNVANATITNATVSGSTLTGALVVTGGVGIGANLRVGTSLDVTGRTTLGEVDAGATTVTNFNATGATVTIGATNSGATTVRNDTTISNTTVASSTQTGALQVKGGVGIGGSLFVGTTATILSTAASTATLQDNALYIAGGVGIGKSLYVTGPTVFNDSVTFAGTSTYVYSTNTVYTDNLINVHVPVGSTGSNHTWTVDDGKDIGFIFHYYKTTDKDAFLGFANDTGYLEWYANGSESGGVFTGTAYGTFKTGAIVLVDTTNAGSTNTGALTVAGGVGVAKDLWIGGGATIRGTITGTVTTSTNLAGGATGGIPYQTGNGTTAFIPIGTTGYIFQSNGTTATWVNTGSVTFGQAVTATNIANGLQYQIPYQTGAGQTGFEAGFEYNYTSNTLSVDNAVINGTSQSATTATGALTVPFGGVGIGGNLVVGGSATATNLVLTGDLAVNGGDITSSATTFNFLNATVTTASILGAGTNITIGATSGATTIQNAMTITNSAQAASTATGALRVPFGGASIGGNLFVGGYATATDVTIVGTEQAGTTATGALSVPYGGVGIGGNLVVGGASTLTGITRVLDSTNAVATNDGALRVTGGAGIVKDVYVGGLITAGATAAATTGSVVPALFFNNTLVSSFTSNAISTTTSQTLDTFSTSTYRSAKYFNQIVSGNNVHISEISIFHDGTKAYINEYGIASNNGTLGSFDASITGGNVAMSFTPSTSTSMVVKMTRFALTL